MRPIILFADNERSIRRACKAFLEEHGYTVLLAEDGAEAVDVLDDYSVDLVVLDERMPRCSGLQAAQTIKHRYPHLPVVLFTADEDLARLKRSPVREVVVKSTEVSALLGAIERSLGRRSLVLEGTAE